MRTQFIKGMAASSMILAGMVNAFVIDSSSAIGDTFSTDFLLTAGSYDGNGNLNGSDVDLSGSAVFELLAFDTTNDLISFNLTLTNTTDANDINVGWQKFAFNTTPDVTGVTFTDADDGEVIAASLGADPEVVNSVGVYLDLQTTTGPGARRTLQAGEFDTFLLTLSFEDLIDSGVEFDPFASKWQSDVGSFEFGSGISVPEPLTLSLFGVGLIGLHLSRRRVSRGE